MSRLRNTAKAIWVTACFGIVLGAAHPVQAQDKTFTIAFAGQSMIRGDTRVDAPESVPVIKSLVKGDAAFTNFEAAVLDLKRGHTLKDGRFLSPPESLEALKSFGFNLVSLANNHSFDLKAAGIENTLDTAARLELAHAGTGRQLDEASKPVYVRTPKGIIALIALASGLIDDGRATPTRLGVNELRLENDKPDRKTPNAFCNACVRRRRPPILLWCPNTTTLTKT